MDGVSTEPARITTHYESDYGAATKVEYRKGQTITVVVPNTSCSRCTGCRAKIVAAPSRPDCRSQIDMAVEVDYRRMVKSIQGYHALVCYGDYLREFGYALAKVGLAWENLNETTT
jgi:hypothetical protein